VVVGERGDRDEGDGVDWDGASSNMIRFWNRAVEEVGSGREQMGLPCGYRESRG
jgi:hypothetical protein